jgi:hypothetical protein
MVLKKIYKLKLNITIILILLLVSMFTTVVINALSEFYNYRKVVDQEMELTLDRFHFFLRKQLNYELMNITSPDPVNDEDSPLKTFHITADQQNIDELNSDLPQSGKEKYIKAYMKEGNGGKIRKISLRYRGDSNYHWLYPQKSLRIKLSGDDIYNMEKKFNLINPPGIISYRDIVNYDLSRKIGLISPDYFPARVFINGSYMGLYMYLSQVDESLLRKHKRMPGSIYYGEGAPVNKDGINSLWSNDKYWVKKASRNSEQESNREDIRFFIKAINDYDDNEFVEFVEKYINKDKYFKFIALDRLFGSHHHNYNNNHRIYFDPYIGKFEPISWDLRFWLSFKQKDLSLYPLQLRITADAFYESEIDKIVYGMIEDNIISYVEKSYENIIDEISRDLESDRLKDNAINMPTLFKDSISTPFRLEELLRQKNEDIGVLKERINFLVNEFNKCEVSFRLKELSHNKYKLIVSVDGNSPASLDLSDFSSLVEVESNNGVKVVDGKLIFYPGKKIENKQKLFSKKQWGRGVVTSYAKKYEVVLSTTDRIDGLYSSISFVNDVTNKKISADRVVSFGNHKADKTIVSDKYSTEKLSGTIRVDKDLIFDKFTNVIIEAGTKFIMAENASVYFYGKVKASGTRVNPITFFASDPTRPWGVVTVQGRAASGSTFEYCQFENGSLDSRQLINYTAPFNIHDVDWFEVRNCRIGKNFIGDDSMHVAYARGVVESCEFHNARSDGLDIDIANVDVMNNIFFKSGNDGLDVMTTKMRASGNVFIEMGDKGISVGEWSEASITDSFFYHAVIGLEIKDKSMVKADSLVFVDSGDKAINLYNKNKRYDEGGFLKAETLYFLGNTMVVSDELSGERIINRIEGELPISNNSWWYRVLHESKYNHYLDKAMGGYVH